MAKFGYRCSCGWTLKRGSLTRKEYAKAKRQHALGIDKNADKFHQPKPCNFLTEELRKTMKSAQLLLLEL